MRLLMASLATVLLFAGPAARADDVTDQINEALEAYRKRDINTAAAALEAALSLLRQNRADSWKTLLPAAPAGWTTEEDTTTVTAAMFGGGTGATRTYRKGDDTVEISILTDSPVVQGLAAVLSNPAIAAAAGRTVVIGGRRMTYVKDDNTYMTMVADKALVRIQGSRGLAETVLRGFVTAMPFAEIEKAVR